MMINTNTYYVTNSHTGSKPVYVTLALTD